MIIIIVILKVYYFSLECINQVPCKINEGVENNL